MSIRPLPVVAAFMVLMVSGLAHGLWTQRWQTSAELEAASTRLRGVPLTAGGWTAVTQEVDPEPFRQTRAVSYWVRRYSKEGAGTITVILMCGRAGHMAVHTPDVCYRGAGFEMDGEPTEQAVDCGPGSMAPAQLWVARFRQPGKAAGLELRIWWSWNSGAGWQAPTAPRLAFGGAPFLYKLYVVRETTGDGGADEVTPAFVRALLPVLEKSLFSPEAPVP
jgi:hypothetical protein